LQAQRKYLETPVLHTKEECAEPVAGFLPQIARCSNPLVLRRAGKAGNENKKTETLVRFSSDASQAVNSELPI